MSYRRSWLEPEIWTVIDRATRTPIMSTRLVSFAVEFCEEDRANREINLANPWRPKRPGTRAA